MITRPVRVHVPCAYLSQIKLRCESYKTKTTQSNEKPFVQSPFIWSPSSVRLCENQAEHIVRKIDIDAVIRNKLQEDLYLTVYSNINRKHTIVNKHSTKNNKYLNNREELINVYLEKHEDTLKRTHIESQNNIVNDSVSNIVKHTNKNLFLSAKFQENSFYSGETPSKDKSSDQKKADDLPSKEQLTEMMMYFSKQAPLLFKPTGWTYQKCSYKIIFENEIIGTKTYSLNSYIVQVDMMKNLTRLVLSNPEFDILQMHRGVADGTVHVRWQVQGVPRYLKPFSLFGLIDERALNRYIDGYSVFYINSEGLYYRHILTKITPLRNGNPLASRLFSNISLHRRGLGDVNEQPIFPVVQEGIK